MGYASNLKKIRKWSQNDIKQVMDKLKDPNLQNEEIFKICEDARKLIEIHFHMKRKDTKLYNRYLSEIDAILVNRIFTLDLIKPKDRTLSIKTLNKKDNAFLYVLMATEYQKLASLHNLLKRTIMPDWFVVETVEDKPVRKPILNEQSITVKKNKSKLENLLKNTYDYLKEHNLYEDLLNKERYLELRKLFSERLIKLEQNASEKETYENSFYRYKFEELNAELRYLEVFIDYIDFVVKPLNEYVEKNIIKED